VWGHQRSGQSTTLAHLSTLGESAAWRQIFVRARHSNIIVFGVKYKTNYELLYSVNHCSANGICPLVELQTKYPKIPRAHQNVSAAFAAPILAPWR
jgi:hypothetical protein